MISQELNDALESAISGDDGRAAVWQKKRTISREKLEGLLRNIVRDLPDDMTVQDMREQLGG